MGYEEGPGGYGSRAGGLCGGRRHEYGNSGAGGGASVKINNKGYRVAGSRKTVNSIGRVTGMELCAGVLCKA